MKSAYLKGLTINVNTNHSENSSSNDNFFHDDSSNLKKISIRNGYSHHNIEHNFYAKPSVMQRKTTGIWQLASWAAGGAAKSQ